MVPPLPIHDQRSAGGVAWRPAAGGGTPEVALVLVGAKRRWQLPKGIIDPGEAPEAAALREVREEAGLETDLVAPIDTIEYWYVGDTRDGERVRFRKRVHFYLLRWRAGEVSGHDREVHEARWVGAASAGEMLAFPTERRVLSRALAMIAEAETGLTKP
jgi:8-oxo-dGTP pyrophosphatase MutT (NUDIX family)